MASYYVTANLTGVAGQHGISVNASGVTLDLGGFELAGVGGGLAHGIRIVTGRTIER
jgi:glutamate synthase domain-containing protein 3